MTTIYQVRLEQRSTADDTLFNNIFYFRPTDEVGPPDGASSLPQALVTASFNDDAGNPISWLDAINAVQSNIIINTLVESISLFNPLDFQVTVLVGGGNIGSPPTSYVDAIRFRSERVRRDIRRGQKRFVGVPENSADNGELTNTTGYFLKLETLRLVLGATLTVPAPSGSFTVVPVIVKRVKFTTPTGGTAYRLPSTEAELGDNFFDAVQWETDFTVSTQTSRRRNPRFTP